MVAIEPFGRTKDDVPVNRAVLTDGFGNFASFLDFGATMQGIEIQLPCGERRDVCLGYDDVHSYETLTGCFGGLIGRSANRIRPAEVEIDHQRYALSENRNGFHMHGGFAGFHQKVWKLKSLGDGIVLSLDSPDGEEGYPGNLHVEIKVRFVARGVLEMHYDAVSDRATMIALTNHSYFNLNGHAAGDALQQKVWIPSESVVAMDNGFFSDGTVPVQDTPMDFRELHTLAPRGEMPLCPQGYNFCYLQENCGLHPTAQLVSSDDLLTMYLETDFPAVQLYEGYAVTDRAGKGGSCYGKNCGVCLEPQYVPNAIHFTAFQKPIFAAGVHFDHTVRYSFFCNEQSE